MNYYKIGILILNILIIGMLQNYLWCNSIINPYTKSKSISKADTLSDGNLFTVINLPELVDSTKGTINYFYVDFWASWCAPCISQLRFTKKLQVDYKSKPIEFVFISVDENDDLWKNTVEKHNLPKNFNFRLSDFKNRDFMRKHEITSFPRYMIFDSSGKMIVSDAPVPSNPEIREVFDELFKR